MIIDLRTQNEETINLEQVFKNLKNVELKKGNEKDAKQQLLNYQKALKNVTTLPDELKSYIANTGVKLPKKDIDSLDKAVNIIRNMTLTKAKLK